MVATPVLGRFWLCALMSAVLVAGGTSCVSRGKNEITPPHIKKYLLEQTHPALDLPEWMETKNFSNIYPVPGGVPAPQRISNAIKMPDALINPATGNIRIQTLDGYSWLLVDIVAAQIWPRIRSFVSVNRLPVEHIDIQEGTIITKWLTPESNLPREKYRLQIDAGLHTNASEIHLIQATEPYLKKHDNQWPKVSVDKERGRIMLDSIAGYLFDLSQDPVAISAAASQFKQAPRMQIKVSETGLSELVLNLEYNRAWAALGLALNKAKMLVLDINRDTGVYYIAYQPTQNLSRRERKRLAKQREQVKAQNEQHAGQQDDVNDELTVDTSAKLATAEIAKRAKDKPKARLYVVREDQHIIIRIDSNQAYDELIINELNDVLKRIATYMS